MIYCSCNVGVLTAHRDIDNLSEPGKFGICHIKNHLFRGQRAVNKSQHTRQHQLGYIRTPARSSISSPHILVVSDRLLALSDPSYHVYTIILEIYQ